MAENKKSHNHSTQQTIKHSAPSQITIPPNAYIPPFYIISSGLILANSTALMGFILLLIFNDNFPFDILNNVFTSTGITIILLMVLMATSWIGILYGKLSSQEGRLTRKNYRDPDNHQSLDPNEIANEDRVSLRVDAAPFDDRVIREADIVFANHAFVYIERFYEETRPSPVQSAGGQSQKMFDKALKVAENDAQQKRLMEQNSPLLEVVENYLSFIIPAITPADEIVSITESSPNVIQIKTILDTYDFKVVDRNLGWFHEQLKELRLRSGLPIEDRAFNSLDPIIQLTPESSDDDLKKALSVLESLNDRIDLIFKLTKKLDMHHLRILSNLHKPLPVVSKLCSNLVDRLIDTAVSTIWWSTGIVWPITIGVVWFWGGNEVLPFLITFLCSVVSLVCLIIGINKFLSLWQIKHAFLNER